MHASTSMDLRELPEEHSVTRHPWEVARADFFIDVLRHSGTLTRGCRVLDAGSGDAYVATRLANAGHDLAPIVCWDAAYDDAMRARLAPPTTRLELTSERPEAIFDIVLALDLLEHVEDDTSFLRALIEHNTAADTTVLLSVPAWPALETAHDHQLLHHRRYTPAKFHQLITDAGLSRLRSGGLFHSLLLPRTASVALERILGRGDRSEHPDPLRWRHGRSATAVVRSALRADNWISRRAADLGVELPGLSLWALCRRTASPATTGR